MLTTRSPCLIYSGLCWTTDVNRTGHNWFRTLLDDGHRRDRRAFQYSALTQSNYSLGAFFNEYSLLKLRGRLHYSDSDINAKYIVILNKNCVISRLVIIDAHEHVLNTLNEVCTKVLDTPGKILSQTYKCILCKKFEEKLLKGLADAPLSHFHPQYIYPFTCTGIDYLRPLLVYPTPSRK